MGGGFAGGGESGGGELQATRYFRTSPSNLASLCMMLVRYMPALHMLVLRAICSRCHGSYLMGGGFAGGGESGGGELQATRYFRTSPSNLASLCMMLRPCMPALHVELS